MQKKKVGNSKYNRYAGILFILSALVTLFFGIYTFIEHRISTLITPLSYDLIAIAIILIMVIIAILLGIFNIKGKLWARIVVLILVIYDIFRLLVQASSFNLRFVDMIHFVLEVPALIFLIMSFLRTKQ